MLFRSMFDVIREMAAWSRAALGDERLTWLRGLPRVQFHGPVALVHASPEGPWRSPLPEASDEELQSVYGRLGRPVAVYGHIHRSFIRNISGLTVVNTGSASLSYDGDPRAAYLLLDDSTPSIRRVAYDLDKEASALAACGLPHSEWVAKLIKGACFQMP